MWSRPIRMPAAKTFARDQPGAAARSSHTAEACVIVTSLSTPNPPTMMPTMSRSWKLIAGASWARSYSFSSANPDRRAAPTANAPSAVVTPRPSSVPASAADVRSDIPCATYKTMNMITVDPASATGMPGLPTMIAGNMKLIRTQAAMTSPTSANRPFQRATAITAATKNTVSTAITGSRFTPLNE